MSDLQKKYISVKAILESRKTRKETFEGKKNLVAPVVMLIEGVHHGIGAAGALYYPASTLEKYAQTWNGVPVPVYHPKTEDGMPISCNSPDIIEKSSVGRIFNARYESDGSKLKAEAWIDMSKADMISPGLLTSIDKGDQVEVSTGLLTEVVVESGVWNNEEYDGVVQGMIPDHLALLPGDKGACSWDDGCGIRANEKGGKKELNENLKKIMIRVFGGNSESILETIDMVHTALNAEVKDSEIYHMMVDLYDDYVVYERWGQGINSKLYRKEYSINDGKVEFSEPEEVRLEKSYKTVNMEVKKMCCEKRVAALIANDKTPYAEKDKEWLVALEEDQFALIEETAVKVEVPVLNTEDKDVTPPTFEELLKSADSATQEMIHVGLSEYKAKKAKLIEDIKANERNIFTDEQLELKPLNELLAIQALAVGKDKETATPDYSGRQVGQTQNISAIPEPLGLPTMFKKEASK